MKKNMGLTDRIIRMALAIIIVILFFAKVIMGVWAIVLLILAGILLLTGIIGFCLPYTIFGWNTNCNCDIKAEESKKEE